MKALPHTSLYLCVQCTSSYTMYVTSSPLPAPGGTRGESTLERVPSVVPTGRTSVAPSTSPTAASVHEQAEEDAGPGM